MKKLKIAYWEAHDLDEKFYGTSEISIHDILHKFHDDYKNCKNYKMTVDNLYDVDFNYEEIVDDDNDEIVIIKYKTSYMQSYKEFFRFLKNNKNELYTEIQIIAIYSQMHVLFGYFHPRDGSMNEIFKTKFSIGYSSDQDPDDIFNYDQFPEYLNGGYDYFTIQINTENVKKSQYDDINFNLSLYNTKMIDNNHDKINILKQKLMEYFDLNISGSILGRAVADFYNSNIAVLKSNVWSKWKKFDIARLPDVFSPRQIAGFKVRNVDGTEEEILFYDYLNFKSYSFHLYRRSYDPNVTQSYFDTITNIKNELLRIEIYNEYIIPYIKSRQEHKIYEIDVDMKLYAYYDLTFLLNDYLDKGYVIPEKIIDVILGLLDSSVNNYFDYLRLAAITKLSMIVYKNKLYLYSKQLYDIIIEFVEFIKNFDPEEIRIFSLKDFIQTLHNFDFPYLQRQYKYIDLNIQFLYNSLKLIKHYSLTKSHGTEMFYRLSHQLMYTINDDKYTNYYYRAVIFNVLVSKNYSQLNPDKNIIPVCCLNTVFRYSSAYYLFTMYYKQKDESYIIYEQSKYDIALLCSINLILNKIIKKCENIDLYIKNLTICHLLTRTKDTTIKRTSKKLGNIAFYLLNTDKYDYNIINIFYEIASTINIVGNGLICSHNAATIASVLIDYLLPEMWTFNVTEENIKDLKKITDKLKPEPGLDHISHSTYNNVRDEIKKYIKDNIS